MDRTRETSGDVLDTLDDLVRLEDEMSAAYTQALAECREADVRATLTNFKGDHDRHLRELRDEVAELRGGTVPARELLARRVEEARSALAHIAGDDDAQLHELLRREHGSVEAYEEACRRLTGTLKEITGKLLHDEHRHARWIEDRIEVLEHPEASDGPRRRSTGTGRSVPLSTERDPSAHREPPAAK